MTVRSQHDAAAPRLGEVFTGGLRLIRQFVRWHPWSFTLAVLGAALFVSAIVASAVVVGRITDLVVIPVLDGGEPIENKVVFAVLAVMAVALWKAAGITLRRTAASALQFRTRADAREKLIEHQLRLQLAWHDRRSTGDLLSVSEVDTQTGTFVLAPLPYATGASLLLFGTIVLVFATHWLLGVIALVGLSILVTIDIKGAFSLFTDFEAAQYERGAVSEIAHESIDGALTVKALGREAEETDRFRQAAAVLQERLVDIGVRFANFRAIVESLPAVINIAILVVGAILVSDGSMTPGQLVSLAYLITLMAFPLQLIGFVIFEMAHSQAAWRRVQEILDADEVIDHGSLAAESTGDGADVDSQDVQFSYTEGDPILSDVRLEIPAGRTVAVVGPTASGKSTLAMLLARLWDPSDGVIHIDGRDLREFARSELALEVAFVAQESFLFDDTVWGNVTLGAELNDDDVLRAMRLAGVERFIADLPDGYDTRIGERGTSLSGGQRQRVALARALVRRPRVLVLDDATSAVDPSVETEILRGLQGAELPSTVVIVAYRRSSIMLTDEVVFMDEGRVVAHGSHDELLEAEPGYERLLRAYEEDAARREEEARP
ncbi:MAG: ABC transporter ATP-binding protein [Actinomycetota bacterium]